MCLKKEYTKQKVVTTFRICITGVYIALVFASQVAIAFIPNVELVTFLLSFAALYFPFSMSFIISLGFAAIEGIFWGFGDWVLLYFIIWPFLVVIIRLCRNLINKYWFLLVIIDSLFGFLFGTIDTIIKLPLYGFGFALAYWIRGFPFDVIHGVSNFWVSLLLFPEISRIWKTNLSRYFY